MVRIEVLDDEAIAALLREDRRELKGFLERVQDSVDRTAANITKKNGFWKSLESLERYDVHVALDPALKSAIGEFRRRRNEYSHGPQYPTLIECRLIPQAASYGHDELSDMCLERPTILSFPVDDECSKDAIGTCSRFVATVDDAVATRLFGVAPQLGDLAARSDDTPHG